MKMIFKALPKRMPITELHTHLPSQGLIHISFIYRFAITTETHNMWLYDDLYFDWVKSECQNINDEIPQIHTPAIDVRLENFLFKKNNRVAQVMEYTTEWCSSARERASEQASAGSALSSWKCELARKRLVPVDLSFDIRCDQKNVSEIEYY